MRRAVLLLTTMALAMLLASGVAQAIINGVPDRNAHPYVGALVTELEVAEDETELLPACSGALISPTVFLTAGHCTEFIIEEGLPTYVSFDPTYEPGASELISGTPYTHPDFCLACAPGLVGFDRYDVGVVVLDEPVTTTKGYAKLPTRGLVDTLERGQSLTAVGYGANDYVAGGGPPSPVYYDVRYKAKVRLVSTENRIADEFVKLSGASAGRGGEGTCFGDSGGPIFYGQKTIVAVNSFVTNGRCAGVTYAQRVDLPEVLTWVRSFL